MVVHVSLACMHALIEDICYRWRESFERDCAAARALVGELEGIMGE